jgi:hypothetical protein
MKLKFHLVTLFVLAGFAMQHGTFADTIVLTRNGGEGKVACNVADTYVDWNGPTVVSHHNAGGKDDMFTYKSGAVGDHLRVGLIRFDLTDLANAGSIESAILRLYQFSLEYGANDKVAQRLTESWTEGTGNAAAAGILNGCNAYARTAPRLVQASQLQATTHNGKNVWYFEVAEDLAVYPVDGNAFYIGRFINTSSTQMDNTNIRSDRMTKKDNLDDLVNQVGENVAPYGYFYDDVAGRVYLRSNQFGIGWYATSDLWAGVAWSGARHYGPQAGSVATAEYKSNLAVNPNPTGWYEIDIAPIVREWLFDNKPNYGVRIKARDNHVGGGSHLNTSENTAGFAPELVVTFTPRPPSGTVITIY